MARGGYVLSINPESPAYRAGLESGDTIISVNGHRLRDVIDWRWYADDCVIDLECSNSRGDLFSVSLERDFSEDWGITFKDILFDGTHECCNNCTFCFVKQLPKESRKSLFIRDDDYRLSFLQGTFATFTNLSSTDESRIIEQHLSPLRYSLHAITPQTRAELIGKRAAYGVAAAERLLSAGIELHAQIVLVPNVNDGKELENTLNWAYAHPGILNVGIVPLGYTKHQSRFRESFDEPESAKRVLETIEPFQQQAVEERGHAWVHAADEFYLNAYREDTLNRIPASSHYGSFDLFEDGIGMVRSFMDAFYTCHDALLKTSRILVDSQTRVLFVCGCAQSYFFSPLLDSSPCKDVIVPLYVQNHYFGGNVDVTGLLCACDIVPAVNDAITRLEGRVICVLPEVLFNTEGRTLDDLDLPTIRENIACPVHVVSCQPSEFLDQIAACSRDWSLHG